MSKALPPYVPLQHGSFLRATGCLAVVLVLSPSFVHARVVGHQHGHQHKDKVKDNDKDKDEDVYFSTNAICRQYNCVNPVFPGVNDLMLLEAATYQCQKVEDARKYMQFCKNVVLYDVALPSPSSNSSSKKSKNSKNSKKGNKKDKADTESTTLEEAVLMQDNAAATMYFYHLSGMMVEPWKNKNADTPCTRAIKNMVCTTYFPRAEAGCKKGEATPYLRPCKNVCTSYVKECDVQCCDESVQCVFKEKISLAHNKEVVMSRYSSELGPSAKCTGSEFPDFSGSQRSARPAGLLVAIGLLLGLEVLAGSGSAGRQAQPHSRHSSTAFLKRYAPLLAMLALATGLQGCYMGEALSHPTPRWMEQPSYIREYQYVPQGATVQEAILNSCNIPGIPVNKQCSGHGVCDTWREDLLMVIAESGETSKPQRYCKCYQDWADPECRTKRKSQQIAYTLSLFGGYLGMDHFYLEQYWTGCLKLATLGGLGVWWLLDIVRIGCAPMYVGSHNWRLAYDLPHWVFVFGSVLFFMVLGYLVFGVGMQAYRREKKISKMLMQAEDEFHKTRAATVPIPPQETVGQPSFASHGIPFSSYGSVPPLVVKSADRFMYSPYAIWQNSKNAFRPSAANMDMAELPSNQSP